MVDKVKYEKSVGGKSSTGVRYRKRSLLHSMIASLLEDGSLV